MFTLMTGDVIPRRLRTMTSCAVPVALLVAALAGPARAQPCTWSLETTPHGGTSLILYAFDGIGDGQTWTVGRRSDFTPPSNFDSFNYIARWDGSAWDETPAPQPSTLRFFQGLHGVLAIGPDDAIAVGSYNPDSGPTQATSMRWDGSDWTLMTSPNYLAGSAFQSIGRAGNTIWAGGHKYSELDPPAALTFPMAARLNGDSWEVTFVPPLAETGGRSYNHIRAIEGASDDDAWAAGIAQQFGNPGAGTGFGPVAMMIHWDGSDWTLYDLFDVVASIYFSSIEGLAVIDANNAWAAGFDYDTDRQVTIPLILRWDGVEWTNVPIPTFPLSAELRAIATRGPNEVYAAGTQTSAGGYPHALILRYDGSIWTEVPQADVVDYGTWFRAMGFVGSTLWAAGQSNDLVPGITQRFNVCTPECPSGSTDGGGVRTDCEGADCPADLTGDGVLDLADVQAFISGFTTQDPIADLAEPFGVFDIADINAFITSFTAGCP